MPRIVKLDVGGTKYKTSLETLTTVEPDSMLATMVQQEREKEMIDNGEKLFIDRNGPLFEYILEYLRNPTSGGIWLPQDLCSIKRLKMESEFFMLDGLTKTISDAILSFPFLPGDNVRFTADAQQLFPLTFTAGKSFYLSTSKSAPVFHSNDRFNSGYVSPDILSTRAAYFVSCDLKYATVRFDELEYLGIQELRQKIKGTFCPGDCGKAGLHDGYYFYRSAGAEHCTEDCFMRPLGIELPVGKIAFKKGTITFQIPVKHIEKCK